MFLTLQFVFNIRSGTNKKFKVDHTLSLKKKNIYLKNNNKVLLVLKTKHGTIVNQSHEVDSTVYSLIEFFLKNKSESDFLFFSSIKNRKFICSNITKYFRKISGVQCVIQKDIKTMNTQIFFLRNLILINHQSMSPTDYIFKIKKLINYIITLNYHKQPETSLMHYIDPRLIFDSLKSKNLGPNCIYCKYDMPSVLWGAFYIEEHPNFIKDLIRDLSNL